MKSLLVLLISLYILILGYLYHAQRSFIYYPSFTRPVAVPPNYQLDNQGVLLKGWVLNKGKSKAMLYFGGNGESIEYNLPLFRKIFTDRAVYLLAYRGYGDSEGEPTEAGIYSDALALYDKIREKYDSISVIGRSLGSGVATYVAVHRETDGVVLVTPYASIEDLAKRQFPILPIGLLLKDKYLSAERVGQIKSKTLIIYAENDQVVPEENTKKLIGKFVANRVEVVKIKRAGHNTISDFSEYETELKNYFNSIQAKR